jgi:Spy/CpxP family protein refolding chaperone
MAAERSPGETRALAVVVLAVTFVSGALAGAGAHHALRPRPPLSPFSLPERELELTAEQRQKIDAIMASHQPQIAQVTGELFAHLRPVAEEIRAQTREVLTPQQREILDRLEKEHGGPPPLIPPGPPGGPRPPPGFGPPPPGFPPPPPP